MPILIGGSGEQKTFGLAVRHAAHLDIICAPDELPRKRAVLDARLAEVGRDHIETSVLVTVVVDETHDKAHAMSARCAALARLRPRHDARGHA